MGGGGTNNGWRKRKYERRRDTCERRRETDFSWRRGTDNKK